MNETSEDVKLHKFGISVGRCDIHTRVLRDEMLYYMCTLAIRNFSSIQSFNLIGCNLLQFDRYKDGIKCSFNLSANQDHVKIEVSIHMDCVVHKRRLAIMTDGGIVLFQETLGVGGKISSGLFGIVDIVSVKGEDFQKLKQLPNDTFILTYRIICSVNELILKHMCSNVSISNSEYLKSLEADLKNCPSAFLTEKVSLSVGSETETVNKAVLYARSTVFAKMFGSDARENKSNTIVIKDIKMPVLRALVSFLSSGFLPDGDFDFLCDVYYAASKYDIWELRQACIRLLLNKVTYGNVLRVLKLAALHNDELLKSPAMALISANIETVALARDWKDLMCDDPVLALKASTFFEF